MVKSIVYLYSFYLLRIILDMGKRQLEFALNIFGNQDGTDNNFFYLKSANQTILFVYSREHFSMWTPNFLKYSFSFLNMVFYKIPFLFLIG